MKKVTKVGSYVLAAAFFSVALSGCGKQVTVDPNANKVIVWSFEEADVWKNIEKEFEKANKGYDLVYQKQTNDADYENRVLNSILSGSGPDVWTMPNDWVYRHKEKLYPMPDAMAKTINMDTAFVPSVKTSVIFDNKIYALTPTAQPLMVYYNEKLINSTKETLIGQAKDAEERKAISNTISTTIPKTWTDFTAMANMLTIKNGTFISQSGLAMGTGAITNAPDILYLLMMQNNVQILSADYKIATFNLPTADAKGEQTNPGKKALDFYTSFSDSASSNYTWNDALGNDIDSFATGKTAMIFGYSELQNTLLQKYPTFRYKKAFVPQLTADSSQIKDFAKFNAFGVSKLSRNPGVSWNLVKLLSTDQSDTFSTATKLYTSKKASTYDTQLSNRESSNPEKLALATAQSLVKNRYPKVFDNTIRNMMIQTNGKTTTSQNALDLAANNLTNLVRKDGWQ